MDATRFYMTKEVAEMIGVHPQTIRYWERSGVIPLATRRRGLRVYTAADVEQIKAAVFEPDRTSPFGHEER